MRQMTKLLLFCPAIDEALFVSRSRLRKSVCVCSKSSKTGKIYRKNKSFDFNEDHCCF